jgi:hypothetical protein
VLFRPEAVLDRLLASAGQQAGIAGSWIGLSWISEAAWQAITSKLGSSDFAIGDRELLVPLAARLRFLALSEPMRWRAEPSRAWWGDESEKIGKSGLVDQVFGEDSGHLLTGRVREARRRWLDCLDAYESHPFLAQATSRELEQELASLIFRHRRGGAPLSLSVRMPLRESAPPTAADLTIISEVTERHFLPRFDLISVGGLAFSDPLRWRRAGRAALGTAAVLAALVTVERAAQLDLRAAAVTAAICYVLIGAGSVALGSSWASIWLLRLPAASAVGLFALVSVLPGGWLTTPSPPGGWAACVALALAAYGYLAVEARNHGIAPGLALVRSAGVATVGAVHALLVSLIGLIVVAPAFISDGSKLADLWRHPGGYGHAGMLLLLATAWCLAVGVFSQILWDDRPITAPLAHLQWRSGGKGQ